MPSDNQWEEQAEKLYTEWSSTHEDADGLLARIATALQSAHEDGVAAERKRAAKVAESHAGGIFNGRSIAAAIRTGEAPAVSASPEAEKSLANEERSHLGTIDMRDGHEERINEIAATLGLDEEAMSWSNLNDVGERCVEAAQLARKDVEIVDWIEEFIQTGVLTTAFELDGGIHLTLATVGDSVEIAYREQNTFREAVQKHIAARAQAKEQG